MLPSWSGRVNCPKTDNNTAVLLCKHNMFVSPYFLTPSVFNVVRVCKWQPHIKREYRNFMCKFAKSNKSVNLDKILILENLCYHFDWCVSLDVSVSRLVEEVKQNCAGVQLQSEDVYMATTFQDFIQMFVRKLRGEDQEEELVIDYVSVVLLFVTIILLSNWIVYILRFLLVVGCCVIVCHRIFQVTREVNNMTVKMPYQCFINGQFEDAENGKTYNTINPTDGSVNHLPIQTHTQTTHAHTLTEEVRFVLLERVWPLPPHQVICKVSYASVGDVDRAVAAAKEAYDNGPWGRMNPRDRGSLLYRWVVSPREPLREKKPLVKVPNGLKHTAKWSNFFFFKDKLYHTMKITLQWKQTMRKLQKHRGMS